MQYDLYLNDEHIGGISAFGLAAQAWVVGYTFRYPHLGTKREFVVDDEVIPECGRIRANVAVIQNAPGGHG
jgi:hypothetical protein